MLNNFSSHKSNEPELVDKGTKGLVIRIELTVTPGTKNLDKLAQMELLEKVLQITNGRKDEAARMLGISLKTVYNRLERFGWSAN